MKVWQTVCSIGTILAGRGVCVLVGEQQIGLFRPTVDKQVYAVNNIDPFAQASVLDRGIIAEHEGEYWIVSPLKKQRFRLKDGWCFDDETKSIMAYPVRINGDQIQLHIE